MALVRHTEGATAGTYLKRRVNLSGPSDGRGAFYHCAVERKHWTLSGDCYEANCSYCWWHYRYHNRIHPAQAWHGCDRLREAPATQAMETSFANGVQLSHSNAAVWNNWQTIAKGINWMFHSNAPLLINPKPSWHNLSWFPEFCLAMPQYGWTPP